jgi:hypothetical protein
METEENIAFMENRDDVLVEEEKTEKTFTPQFFSGKIKDYSIGQKIALCKVIEKNKLEYDECIKNPKTYYNKKKNKFVPEVPKQGYLSKTVREYYYNLKNLLSTDKLFRKAYAMAARAFEEFEKGNLIMPVEKRPTKVA